MQKHSTNLLKDEVSITLKGLRIQFLEIQKLGGDLTPEAVDKLIVTMDAAIRYSEDQFKEFHEARQFIAGLVPVTFGGETLN